MAAALPARGSTSGCIPAVVRRTDGSHVAGTSEAEGRRTPLRLEEGEEALAKLGGRAHGLDATWRACPRRSRRAPFPTPAGSGRETCICEMPTRAAICDCVRPSQKRMWMIRRSRSSRMSRLAPNGAIFADLVLVLELPQGLERAEPPSSPGPEGAGIATRSSTPGSTGVPRGLPPPSRRRPRPARGSSASARARR